MADIELVIKVDERDVDLVRKNFKSMGYSFIPLHIQTEFVSAILNGTPLPKGHGKIIDATFALEAKITKDNIGVSERTKGWNEACQAIYENASTIIGADKPDDGTRPYYANDWL